MRPGISVPIAPRVHQPSPTSLAPQDVTDHPHRTMIWLAAGLLLVPWLISTIHRCMGLDFWYDEIYTLDHFVFVSPYRTVTDYSYPNNHILFSLLTNVYAAWLGLSDTLAAMDTPWMLRLPSLLCAGLTLGLTFQIARQWCGRAVGLLAMVLLATTLPFFQFACQVRGYSLSTLLLTAMLYALLRWRQVLRIGWILAAGVAGALALYTLPSNLYFLAGLGAFYLVAALHSTRTAPESPGTLLRRSARQLATPDAAAVLALAGGLVAGVTLYLPVLRQLLSHDYLQPHGRCRFETITTLMPQMFTYLLSGRAWLVPLPAAAILAGLPLWSRAPDRRLWRPFLLCLTVLLVPFVCSWIRGDQAPPRVFVNLSPVFALFMAVSIRMACDTLLGRRGLVGAATIAIVACYLTLGLSLRDIDRHMLADIEQGRMSAETALASYQAFFSPLQIVKHLQQDCRARPGPIYVYEYGDRMAMARYMQKTRLSHAAITDPDAIEIEPGGVAYVITAWPDNVLRRILRSRPGLQCQILTPQPNLFGILLCRLASPSVSSSPQPGSSARPG